jgi:hypothetical protein
MSDDIEILFYLGAFLFVQFLVIYNVFQLSKKNDFDFGDNEIVLRPKIIPHLYVALITLFFAGIVLRELDDNLLVELVVAILISSAITLINIRMIFVTLYFRGNRVIIYKHANKSAEVLLMKNIKEVKRNIHFKRYAELSIFYYNEYQDRISTKNFRGVLITDFKKLKKYLDSKNIPCSEYSKSMLDEL